MNSGAMNFPIKPLLREIEEIGEMGFDYVELTMDPPEAIPQKILAQKRAIIETLHRYAMESLEAILKKAVNLNITLCIENMFPQAHFFSQPHEFQTVFETFPEIRLTLDIGHANLGSGKNRSSEFIRLHGYRIGHVHANDNFRSEEHTS